MYESIWGSKWDSPRPHYSPERLEQLIKEWQIARYETMNCQKSLYEFIGWTAEEYLHWAETKEQP